MKYQICFEYRKDGNPIRFNRYRTVEKRSQAWDLAEKIMGEYNKKHKVKCKIVGVWNNHKDASVRCNKRGKV
jgi:hypothetical protein